MPGTSMTELRAASRKLSAADYAGTIRAFYPYWDAQYRPYLLAAVAAFPADRLDFKPHPELLTARQTIVHIAEAERAWIRRVVESGEEELWVVPHEDSRQGWTLAIDAPDHAALYALLEEWHRLTQHWLEQPAGELERVILFTAEDGIARRYTLHWILDHLQEHEIHHRAHLNLYLRLMGITPPSI